MPSHQIEQIVYIHFVVLISLSELLEVYVFLLRRDYSGESEVLHEEVVEGVFFCQLKFGINVIGQRPQNPLEVDHLHQLLLIIYHKELANKPRKFAKLTLIMN